MKRQMLFVLTLGFMLTTSCEKEEQSFDESNIVNVEEVLASKRKYYVSEILEKQLKEDTTTSRTSSDVEM
ncbi:hypothetical protein ACJRPK_02250 [Aquimarina sp. 2-A2]|uniref:hypothetical protein n=1 Tax=Aquimarina sp. 2-A2 TaxID=3382644 RepID=UPI00387EFA20